MKTDKSDRLYEFITGFGLTYLYPINPVFDLFSSHRKLVKFFATIQVVLGCALLFVKLGAFGGSLPILGWIFVIIAYALVTTFNGGFLIIFKISVLTVYVLGYFQLLRMFMKKL